jgi:hypothetical protein
VVATKEDVPQLLKHFRSEVASKKQTTAKTKAKCGGSSPSTALRVRMTNFFQVLYTISEITVLPILFAGIRANSACAS